MASSSQDRIDVIFASYNSARNGMDADIAQAASNAEANAIRANVDSLHAAYLRAEREGLQANGAEVEAAYQAAKAAADAVQDAYEQGKALADRIRAVSGAVTAVASLLEKAAAL